MKVAGELPVTATYGDHSKQLTLYIVPLQHLWDKYSSLFEGTLGTIKYYVTLL